MTSVCILLAFIGCVAITIGVGLVWSVGGACIVGGTLAVAAAVLLFDPKAGSGA